MSEMVSIPDAGLRRALKYMGLPLRGDAVAREELERLSRVDWSSDGIGEHDPKLFLPVTDLTGLAACDRLVELGLTGNAVRSLEPLRGVARLEQLWLAYNDLRDVAALSTARELRTLVLDGNRAVVDVSSLRGLPRLEMVGLSDTGVIDFSPLLACPALVSLRVYRCAVGGAGPGADALVELIARGVQVEGDPAAVAPLHEAAARRTLARAARGDGASAGDPSARVRDLFLAVAAAEPALLAVEHGPNARDPKGLTLLHRAVMLLERPTPMPGTPADDAPLATGNAVLDVVRALLDAGADPNAQGDDTYRTTALTKLLGEVLGGPYGALTDVRATPDAVVAIVTLLLERGASPDRPAARPALAALLQRARSDRSAPDAGALLERLIAVLIAKGADLANTAVLTHAVESRRPDLVARCLDAGADPHAEVDGFSALGRALTRNDLALVTLLLAKGADPLCATAAYAPAVHQVRSVEALDLMLARGAVVTGISQLGRSILHRVAEWATESDDDLARALALVDRLVALGVDPNASGGLSHETPAHAVCGRGLYGDHGPRGAAFVAHLVKHGADVNALDARQRTPFELGSASELKAGLKKLGAKTGATHVKALRKIVDQALAAGDLSASATTAVLTLGAAGALSPEDEARILALAVPPGDPVAQALVPFGAQATLRWRERGKDSLDRGKCNLLQLVCATRDEGITGGEGGAAVDKPAARSRAMRALIGAGVDPRYVAPDGSTALSRWLATASPPDPDDLELLLDPSLLELPAVRPPLEVIARRWWERRDKPPAWQQAFDRVVARLVDAGARLASPSTFLALCGYGRLDLVEQAIAQGADVARVDGHEASPLHEAVKNDRAEVAERLIAAGAPPSSGAEAGYPAVLCSTSRAWLERFAAWGADLRARGYFGQDVGHRIAGNGLISGEETVRALRFLVEKGVALDRPDQHGSTALANLAHKEPRAAVEAFVSAYRSAR